MMSTFCQTDPAGEAAAQQEGICDMACHRGARGGRGRGEGLNANDRAVQGPDRDMDRVHPRGARAHARPDAPIPRKTTVKKSQVKMPAEKQIFQEQADDSFKFCKAKRLVDDKFNKLLLTKTQTCPWTLESLFEKSDAVRKQKGLPLEPRMAGMASGLGNPGAAAACPGDKTSNNPTGWRTVADSDEGDDACGSMADDGTLLLSLGRR